MTTEHRPSVVLELRPPQWTFCLKCGQAWPCANAGGDS
jgi:hypothetical protein